ncbi:O-acetylhomoserine aminocarboxypropyltransferase/cysteine synthase family protein [Streptococcus sp. BJSWXB6CM1]|uniref:O-acetylhomoserine aminocarboxypropyltransferase/cysteine synthase family protein n=1 Tax=Streptococcus fermentans TaxID=3095082 RepID=A0ABU5FV99_9STRE|nr:MULTISPECIES: O-acetylhomoserine aminocarboxypropyltransferase/cysteine synthase family protein [unclassified Streptococcus]MDY4345657.1 O-acetylhomoserine aminocarboxypropyltransferase/cysteine synthase family protein [Streptococcus sp. BJSWXB5TM5]MDY4360749.1 O-acetylhomoserine aminocarboxypropyltransferase/cysteine synthase family protein [Streptococcus sp. BJSWXB3CM3]MDY4370882.1 O-acetylhomoserine aminocarboxypropyltransferase/cysteine synthase family protein [Streptococcus sp. BJSWXB6CM
MTREFKFETLQLHAGQVVDATTKSRAVPIYQTTSFVFEDTQEGADLFALQKAGNIYTRITNPTTSAFEERIAALEGGVGALATASGMAALTYTILGLAHAGDHVVAASTIYGGTFNLLKETLPRYGITTTFVDIDNLEELEAAIKDNTKLVLIETLGNPVINIPDIEKIAEIAHNHQIPLVADNTFATPYLINVFSHGVDIAVHSATKFIGGHGTTIGGVIVDSGKFDWAASGKFPQLVEEDPSYHNISYTRDVGAAAFIVAARVQLLRDMGAALSPFNSFLLLQGLETLSLRVERHVQNAEKIVDFLVNHPKVEKVNYPKLPDSPYHALAEKYLPKGVGSIFTFHVKGGEAEARKVIDNLEIFSNLANVADAKSLVVHPATTTHAQLSDSDLEAAGVTKNQIRLSIGLENVDDLIEDLRLALEKI